MHYELEPDNRNCSDEILLEDLRKVASNLGKTSITQMEYTSVGRFSAATLKKRFGTWNQALKQADLEFSKRNNIPKDELLVDLRRTAAELETDVLTVESYKNAGKFSPPTISRTFGSWEQAMTEAGLKVSSSWRPKIENELLFSNLASVWEKIGRQPKQSDLRPPISEISASVYKRRFGSWRKALEKFVEQTTESRPSKHDTQRKQPEINIERSLNTQTNKTPRDPSWKLRFLVNRRDRFACRACGRSPANEVGVVLHVDHVVPWSKGGETIMENLQTLCEKCNLGKSDLSMYEHES